MPRLSRSTARSRDRSGFTLTETIVVLIILSIVGTAVFRVLNKQQQSYKDSAKQSTMQREIRLTASFLPADLRSMSSAGGDVIAMGEDAVTFLANTGSGVVCARPGMAAEIHLPPLLAAGVTLTNWSSQPVVGDSLFLYNDSLKVGSEDDGWARRAVSSITSSSGYCPGAPFTDPTLDAGKLRYRVIVSGGIPDSVKVGAVVRFARPVRYALAAAASGKWYLNYSEYVSGGWSTPEPIGGPFRPFIAGDANPSGLQLRYFDSLGVRLDPAQKTRVSRIDVYLRTNAGLAAVTERRPNDLRDSVMMRVAVRNFK